MGRMMLDPPSAAFAPLEELQGWLVRCQKMRGEFRDDPNALADIGESEHEVRTALQRRMHSDSEPAIP